MGSVYNITWMQIHGGQHLGDLLAIEFLAIEEITILFLTAKRQESPRADSTKHSKPKTLETLMTLAKLLLCWCHCCHCHCCWCQFTCCCRCGCGCVVVVVVVVVVVGKRWSPEPPRLESWKIWSINWKQNAPKFRTPGTPRNLNMYPGKDW